MAREAFVNISNYDAGAGLSESMPVQGAGVMENPKDFYFGKTKEKKKKEGTDFTVAEIEAGGVGQGNKLAKGEGVAEHLPAKCWRHLAQKALALGVMGRLSACLR